MSLRNSWTGAARRASRRFTTLEGWREIGNGVYTAGPGVRILSIRHQFDPECYNDDRLSWTRPSVSDTSSTISWGWDQSRSSAVENNDKAGDEVITTKRADTPEKSYHVFSQKQKWTVVVMIGVAGLFSGLSSNIYFPALDAIARVKCFSFRSIREKDLLTDPGPER